MATPFVLDRSLPVPLGVQLRGLIEYGIACGQLVGGERLPSVRELAAELAIAPMTVAAVYRELRRAQLIVTRPGAGTFVMEPSHEPSHEPSTADALRRFDELLDRVLSEAELHGIGRDALIARLSAGAIRLPRPLRLVLVGIFADASRRYAEALRARLPGGDMIESQTMDSLSRDADARRRARSAHLIVTLANRRGEVASMFTGGPPVLGISFVPSESTRVALAGLDPLARVAVVSVFPEFLAVMKPGVQGHAPHVTEIAATLLDAPDLGSVIARCDAVVFATGAEAVLARLPPGLRAIEYRHIPDPRVIERDLLPRLAALRAAPDRSAVPVMEDVA
jgi:DNA-binding transcriptional regulator YhcF (GntR family)